MIFIDPQVYDIFARLLFYIFRQYNDQAQPPTGNMQITLGWLLYPPQADKP